MVIDTHCHLNDKELYKQRDFLVKKALTVGVKKMICVGYDYPSSLLAVQIAHEYPGIVYAAVGIHPSETVRADAEDLQKIEKLLSDPAVVAVGEIGLDFHFDDVPELIQKDYFAKQIKLADEYSKPIIVHMRDASKATLDVFNDYKDYVHYGIIHCYSGSAEQVKDFVNYGMYISFGGPLTFTNAKTPKEAILEVPTDRLLFETDSPYLAPHPLRGQLNDPSNTILVVKEAAKILGQSEEDLGTIETNNVRKLFNI